MGSSPAAYVSCKQASVRPPLMSAETWTWEIFIGLGLDRPPCLGHCANKGRVRGIPLLNATQVHCKQMPTKNSLWTAFTHHLTHLLARWGSQKLLIRWCSSEASRKHSSQGKLSGHFLTSFIHEFPRQFRQLFSKRQWKGIKMKSLLPVCLPHLSHSQNKLGGIPCILPFLKLPCPTALVPHHLYQNCVAAVQAGRSQVC